MSKTLNLAEQLLLLGRNHLHCGRDSEALQILTKLIQLRDLQATVAEEAQYHLAELYRRRGQFAKARRHLHVAMACHPGCARYHHLVATTLDEEDHEDIERAVYHYERALELDSTVPEYHGDYGLYLLTVGRTREGLRRLEKAIELAPEHPRFVHELAIALADEGEFSKARRIVLAALFRNPDDPRIRLLWDELRFREARHAQQQARIEAAKPKASPATLPFRRPKDRAARKMRTKDGSTLRLDPPAAVSKPHTGRRQPRPHRS